MDDFRIDIAFSHAPSNQLCVLRAEVENQDVLLLHTPNPSAFNGLNPEFCRDSGKNEREGESPKRSILLERDCTGDVPVVQLAWSAGEGAV